MGRRRRRLYFIYIYIFFFFFPLCSFTTLDCALEIYSHLGFQLGRGASELPVGAIAAGSGRQQSSKHIRGTRQMTRRWYFIFFFFFSSLVVVHNGWIYLWKKKDTAGRKRYIRGAAFFSTIRGLTIDSTVQLLHLSVLKVARIHRERERIETAERPWKKKKISPNVLLLNFFFFFFFSPPKNCLRLNCSLGAACNKEKCQQESSSSSRWCSSPCLRSSWKANITNTSVRWRISSLSPPAPYTRQISWSGIEMMTGFVVKTVANSGTSS